MNTFSNMKGAFEWHVKRAGALAEREVRLKVEVDPDSIYKGTVFVCEKVYFFSQVKIIYGSSKSKLHCMSCAYFAY